MGHCRTIKISSNHSDLLQGSFRSTDGLRSDPKDYFWKLTEMAKIAEVEYWIINGVYSDRYLNLEIGNKSDK